MTNKTLLDRRARLLGPNNPLFYDDPVHVVRGEGVWLYGADGAKFLDCYNNVPCVGHCHPRVVEALVGQAITLNTHTRYLSETILDYGEALLAKFDPALERIALCCTGSEANDLALRIARLNTGGRGFICTNATYHGNTAAVAQLSSIFPPFEGVGRHVRMVSWPDSYRVELGSDPNLLAETYAEEVRQAIQSFAEEGIPFAGMIVCPIFANEGLSNIKPQYLRRTVDIVRAAGGLFIADEVQSGFGRTGHWWGYEASDIVPDIVTLGKPMAAGHPVSAVVARADLIDNFRRQEMYFNTYGGNNVSCAVAHAVLNVLVEEKLPKNAQTVGRYLQGHFDKLSRKHDLIGDVRGDGLFFGIELVLDKRTKAPATDEARRIVNAMRRGGILISRIGEHDNVLKIRPPLCFSQDNADMLVAALEEAFVRL